MSHMVAYEQAVSEKDKALAAIAVVGFKSSRRLAWHWAGTAVGHAEKAGVEDAGYLVGDDRWPILDELKEALLGLQAQGKDMVIEVADGFYWRFSDKTPNEAAAYLAERSRHVLLHVEPCGTGEPTQELVRKLYFELGGMAEDPLAYE